MAPAHAMLGFEVADHGFDGRSASQFALDLFGDAPLLAGDVDLEAILRRGVVAAVAAVDDQTRQADADLLLEVRNDRRERVAVVGIARKRRPLGDELAALRTMERRGDRRLDAELVRTMRLALADAFDLGRMQGID